MYWKKGGNSFDTELNFSSRYRWDLGRFMQSSSGTEISNSWIFTAWCPKGSSSAVGKHDCFAWWGSYKIWSENSSCNSERQSHTKIIPQHSAWEPRLDSPPAARWTYIFPSWGKRWKVVHLWFRVPAKATRNHLGGEQRGKLHVFVAVPWIRCEASGFVSRGRGRSVRQNVWLKVQTHTLINHMCRTENGLLCVCVCLCWRIQNLEMSV